MYSREIHLRPKTLVPVFTGVFKYFKVTHLCYQPVFEAAVLSRGPSDTCQDSDEGCSTLMLPAAILPPLFPVHPHVAGCTYLMWPKYKSIEFWDEEQLLQAGIHLVICDLSIQKEHIYNTLGDTAGLVWLANKPLPWKKAQRRWIRAMSSAKNARNDCPVLLSKLNLSQHKVGVTFVFRVQLYQQVIKSCKQPSLR